MCAGFLFLLAGKIWLILIVMRGSLLAGLLCVVVPFLYLFFIQEHWDVAKPAVQTWAGGIALIILGGAVHLFVG